MQLRRKEREIMKKVLAIVLVLILIAGVVGLVYACNFNDTEYVVTVTDKERVVSSESSKYLVFCDDADGNSLVFQNTDCLLRGKLNSSNIQGQLKEGETYEIVVVGFRIPFFSSYQNIIKVTESEG